MRDGRVDVYDSGCGVQNTVTIDTDRHQCDISMLHIKFRRGAGSPFQRAAPAGCCPQTTGQRP